MEGSAPQVVGSLLPFEEFTAPVYNQVHQEQIVAGETTQNIVEIPIVQEQVIVHEIPQFPVVDWTPEQIVETIGVLPQERVQQHTAIQIVHVPVPQSQEQSAVTILINPLPAQTRLATSRFKVHGHESRVQGFRFRVQSDTSQTFFHGHIHRSSHTHVRKQERGLGGWDDKWSNSCAGETLDIQLGSLASSRVRA